MLPTGNYALLCFSRKLCQLCQSIRRTTQAASQSVTAGAWAPRISIGHAHAGSRRCPSALSLRKEGGAKGRKQASESRVNDTTGGSNRKLTACTALGCPPEFSRSCLRATVGNALGARNNSRQPVHRCEQLPPALWPSRLPTLVARAQMTTEKRGSHTHKRFAEI